MKYFIFILIVLNYSAIFSQTGEVAKYDSILAKQLNADEYGMCTYYMVYLKIGANRSQSKEESDKIQRAHLDNINKLAEQGKLIIAGPFLDKGDVRGIFIFNVSSFEEAEALTKTDPAVISGRLIMEIHPWYGSASLQLIPNLHKKIAKTEI